MGGVINRMLSSVFVGMTVAVSEDGVVKGRPKALILTERGVRADSLPPGHNVPARTHP